MALSQCLEDSPCLRLFSKGERDVNVEELYNERHRLALEELLSGGVDSYFEFLKKEKIPNFLSNDEIKRISRSAVVPKPLTLFEDETQTEQSASTSMDCSSVTYFPDVSDVEPPILELGWPAFTTGSFRGVTRAVAYFQPSYGECIYSCKEAARKMIKGAKELIAIVTDSLTDLDVFRDLQEACTRRKVPVYILLDQVAVPSFLQMCSNLHVRLDELRLMRVRSITGCTYYMRSGARITGNVHERFMLIDGHKVATGSYRFNWTDGKLNSSNLIELTGQITEKFDEEFRILYAQSLPLSTRDCPASVRNSGLFDHPLLKLPTTPTPLAKTPRTGMPEQVSCLTSTPNHAQLKQAFQPSPKVAVKTKPSSRTSNTSTLGEDIMQPDFLQEELPPCGSPAPVTGPTSALPPRTATQHPSSQCPTTEAVDSLASTMSTQTCSQRVMVAKAVQTDPDATLQTSVSHRSPPSCATSVKATSDYTSSSSTSESTASLPQADLKVGPRPPIRQQHMAGTHNASLKENFRRLSKERQGHYASIRSKLDNMVAMLSHRRELVDLTNLALSPALRRRNAQPQCRRAGGVTMDTTFMGTWPRSRGLQ